MSWKTPLWNILSLYGSFKMIQGFNKNKNYSKQRVFDKFDDIVCYKSENAYIDHKS